MRKSAKAFLPTCAAAAAAALLAAATAPTHAAFAAQPPAATQPASPPPANSTPPSSTAPPAPDPATAPSTTWAPSRQPASAPLPSQNPAGAPADSPPSSSAPSQEVPPGTPTAAPATADDPTDGGTSLLNTRTFGGNAVSHADRRFARVAVANNLLAIEIGRLAMQKAENPAVKSFAKTFVDDSDKVHVRLLVAGNASGVTLPGELAGKARAAYASLDTLSGADFDRAFLDAVVKRHEEDLGHFEREARNWFAEVNLRKFANEALPVLRQEVEAAKSLQGTLAGAPPAAAPAPAPSSGGAAR